jgi:hypothetical protein
MDQARNVTAQFTATTHTLTVVKQGGGSGTVSNNPAGVDCGADCSSYTDGTSVTLSATPAAGSTFAGWDGEGCSGTGTCTVTMSQARTVTATFGIQPSEPITTPPPLPPPPDDSPTPDPDPDDPPVTGDETPPVAGIASDRLRMSERGFVRVRIDCSASPEDCLGVVRLRLRRPADASTAALRTVARADFEITAGDAKRVRLRLKPGARRRVRREGRVRVRVVAVVEDAAGNARTLRARLRLLAPR